MFETKVIKDYGEDVNDVVQLWEAFGWNVKSVQEINYSNNYDELVLKKSFTGKINGLNVVEHRENTHYYTLTLQRNTSMSNYNNLVALENQYNSIFREYTTKKSEIEEKNSQSRKAGRRIIFVSIVIIILCWLFAPIDEFIDMYKSSFSNIFGENARSYDYLLIVATPIFLLPIILFVYGVKTYREKYSFDEEQELLSRAKNVIDQARIIRKI